jgi:hypothetical protein
MISPDRKSAWTSYANRWGGWIFRWLDFEETQALGEQIPQSWVDIVANPCAETIKKNWTEAADSLPRFVDYLTHSILEARVADSQLGYLLVYFLKDWRELGIEEYSDGFMMSGLPTAADDIAQFETEVGTLPISLRSLWLTHGFIQRHDGTFTTSLQVQQQKLVHAPKMYPARRDSWQKGRVLDCLAIADVMGEIVPSLSRKVGIESWDDYLVDVMRWSDSMRENLHVHLDNFLADWTLSEWNTPDRPTSS